MKSYFFTFFAFLLLFSACQQPAQTGSAITPASAKCPDFYYYYNHEKIPLTVLPQFITVGFTGTTTAAAKEEVLRTFPAFSKIASEHKAESGTFQVIELKPNQTCTDVLQLTKALQKQTAVVFANPVFAAPSTLAGDYNWIGITSEFLVTLKSDDAAGDFKKLLTETNTRIADKLSETSFTVTADKTAKGNALEMANLFQAQPWVASSEPNFHFSNKQDVGAEQK